MSRPDTATTAEPQIPRAQRTVHRRPAPVPLRVVARRLGPDEVARLAEQPAPAVAAPSGAAPMVTPAPLGGALGALEAPPLPSPEIVGLPARAERPLPVLDRRAPRRPFARLLALVRNRRRAEVAGRHRPETTPNPNWSMFAPSRRSRRRFGVRR